MESSWLTAGQAAARLGIKPASLYAYVSRGVIPRRRAPDGRRSYFDRDDIERLAKRTPHSRLAPTDIVIPTSISLVDGANGRLWYRGVDAIEASAKHRFEAVAEFLWTGRWNAGDAWHAEPACVRAAARAQRALPRVTAPLDRLGVIVSAARAADPSRSYRSPLAAVGMGCNLLATIVESMPLVESESDAPMLAARLWPRLTSAAPSRDRIALLDRTLSLGAEHGVTLSVVAARLAASSGADVYSAVAAALGPALAAITESSFPDMERSIASGTRYESRHESPYTAGDPRAQPILDAIRTLEPAKSAAVDAAAGPLPDMSFATAATCFAFDFAPGAAELVTAFARIAGWVAHVIAEFKQPTPFRPHATYTGSLPLTERDEPKLLHAVMNYLREEEL